VIYRHLKTAASKARDELLRYLRHEAIPSPVHSLRGGFGPGCWSTGMVFDFTPDPSCGGPHTEISESRFGVTASWRFEPRTQPNVGALLAVEPQQSSEWDHIPPPPKRSPARFSTLAALRVGWEVHFRVWDAPLAALFSDSMQLSPNRKSARAHWTLSAC
jgi:hypothetical protein